MQFYSQASHDLPKQLPLFINPMAGTAPLLLSQLRQQERLIIHEVKPDRLKAALIAEVQAGTPRVLVCGGDGTLALAASALVGTETAMAVVPGGTLNHFAHNWSLPTELTAAVDLAFSSSCLTPVDVAYVNKHLFLNTSSVGSYVRFVKLRELYERHCSYKLASFLAGLKSLFRLHHSRLYIDGMKLRSPLVFIGVRERDLSLGGLGAVQTNATEALHVLIVHADTTWKLARLVSNVIFRGLDPVAKTEDLESRLLDSMQIDNRKHKKSIYVALDGELTLQATPLNYRYVPNALKIVTPDPHNAE